MKLKSDYFSKHHRCLRVNRVGPDRPLEAAKITRLDIKSKFYSFFMLSWPVSTGLVRQPEMLHCSFKDETCAGEKSSFCWKNESSTYKTSALMILCWSFLYNILYSDKTIKQTIFLTKGLKDNRTKANVSAAWCLQVPGETSRSLWNPRFLPPPPSLLNYFKSLSVLILRSNIARVSADVCKLRAFL